MKLAYYLFESPLDFTENDVNVLIIENPGFFQKIVSGLTAQADGESGEFVLSDYLDTLEFSRTVEVISDFYRLDFSSRRFNQKIQQEAITATHYFPEKCEEIFRAVHELASLLSTELKFDVTYNDLQTAEGIIKLLNFSLDATDLSFEERLLSYVKICRDLFGKKLFIFVNLKSTVDPNKLELLYKNLLYEKINFLLIEPVQRAPLAHEKFKIIDSDLCEI